MDFLSIVKKNIDKMDYYCLLSEGAPSDEFDEESLEICKMISSKSDSIEIAKIIAEVFNKAFSNGDSYECFIKCAESICKDLGK